MPKRFEKSPQSSINKIVILSKAERFERISTLIIPNEMHLMLRVDSLKDLFNFTRDFGTTKELILDLKFAPNLDGQVVRELRALGWDHIILILDRRDRLKIRKLLNFQCEQILILPDVKSKAVISPKMTKDELLIMQMLADGFTIATIAKKLHFSPQTIRRILKKMLKRLGYTRRIRLLSDLFREGALK